jgi:AcrR family transcriptional regulator
MAKKDKSATDSSTEEKIREAARVVFMKKGYAATRTRDIAEEAGINLALLNYYFRSKEKLFEQIMAEKFQKFFGIILPIINGADTSLEEKIEMIANNYINILSTNPDLPIFVLSEIQTNPERFVSNTQLKKVVTESVFVKQLHEKRPDMMPFQLISTIMGVTIYPFLMKPLMFSVKSIDQQEFEAMMEQRKKLIPKWIDAVLKIS